MDKLRDIGADMKVDIRSFRSHSDRPAFRPTLRILSILAATLVSVALWIGIYVAVRWVLA